MISKQRRQFMQTLGLMAGGILLSPLISKDSALADAKTPLLDVKDPTAKAVKYVEDYKKVPQAKGNRCSNCSFYKKADTRNGKEVGTCLIFPAKYVLADGYCNSWAKKA